MYQRYQPLEQWWLQDFVLGCRGCDVRGTGIRYIALSVCGLSEDNQDDFGGLEPLSPSSLPGSACALMSTTGLFCLAAFDRLLLTASLNREIQSTGPFWEIQSTGSFHASPNRAISPVSPTTLSSIIQYIIFTKRALPPKRLEALRFM